jgi:carboxymethylenebutenolidase
MSKMIDIKPLDGSGSFPGYCAEPADRPQAAIVVIQEIFGINAGIRRKCDLLAEAGYLAIAPDVFWRIAPGIELDPDIKPELEQAFELANKFDQNQAFRDIEATIQTARDRLGEDGKVGVVGYCLGGRLAFMTALRTDVDASVGYYGVGIDGLIGEKDAIMHPLMLHIGKNDRLVDPATQARMHEGLDGHPHVTLYDYEGVDHGFATEFGQRRSEAAATLADERTAKFFEQNLR